MSEPEERARAEHVERTLARNVAWIVPAGTVLLSIGLGTVFGVGPAILVLAAGALVGVIGLLWASLRTLAGDAPLAEGLASASLARSGGGLAAERKQRVLRSLKDLELEHSLGKIDDRDYAEISAKYREEAKGILREMDVEIEPLRPKAEALVRNHLAKKGLLGERTKKEASAEPRTDESPADGRVQCVKCSASNEPDAAFCKKCGSSLEPPAHAEAAELVTAEAKDA